MTKDDWKLIKQAFNEAVELPLLERQNYLHSKFNGKSELRFEVEKMLAFADDETEFDTLEMNAFDLFSDARLKHPEKIGEYRITRELGRGGMGTVYDAVRETDNFTQRVALKVIKRGMDSDAVIRRFRHEQQIISSLEHPYIARFLDGGVTDEGLPFYAMEFVEGTFIDDYCCVRELGIKDRIELFRKVCAAVQFAHQNLIVHRDIKPQNVLVTDEGTPKLLDFGIGKLLSDDAAMDMATATQLGMMTPAYASPEQIRDERIGTASDVYSLGIVLFELLTGNKPYRVLTNSRFELERAILETDPEKPSSIGSGPDEDSSERKLNAIDKRSLKGDLDNVVLKAIRKDPNERYSSVQELSEDLRRHLVGLPVSARPLTLSYRAAKFFKRNKITAVAGALIFISLFAGLTIALWQAAEARAARTRAENRFAQVRELANNVIFKYHDSIAELPGSTAAREMLVRDALAYLDSLSSEASDNPDLQRELAQAYLKLGDVQGKMYAANIGDTRGAEQSYQKAANLLESIAGVRPQDLGSKELLVDAYDNLAFIGLRSGSQDHKREFIDKAIELQKELIALSPESTKHQLRLIELYVRLGDVDVGNSAEFGGQNFQIRLDHHLKAIEPAERLVKQTGGDFEAVKTLARVYQRIGTDHFNIGIQAEERGSNELAVESFSKALEFHRKMYREVQKMAAMNVENASVDRYIASSYTNMANSLAVNGMFAEALKMAEKNLEKANEILQNDKANKEASLDLALAYEVFADIYSRQKNYRRSLEFHKKTLAVEQKIYEFDKANNEVFIRINRRKKKIDEISRLAAGKS
ncbi:MAG: protein kinase [Pyrinomonadaceae bacterium]|nr:protein kinase [Pyrinomonadaceae bacterium]